MYLLHLFATLGNEVHVASKSLCFLGEFGSKGFNCDDQSVSFYVSDSCFESESAAYINWFLEIDVREILHYNEVLSIFASCHPSQFDHISNQKASKYFSVHVSLLRVHDLSLLYESFRDWIASLLLNRSYFLTF
jgi:hypothetical protein